MADRARRVLQELFDAGYLSPVECQEDTFSLEERPGRNDLIVIRTRRRTITVKRFRDPDGRLRSATALVSLAGERRCFDVAVLLAEQDDVLICASPPSMVAWHERLRDRPPRSRVAARVGRAIAALHRAAVPELPDGATLGIFPTEPDVGLLNASAGAREVIRQIQDKGLEGPLSKVADRLRADPPVFCHGDVRSTNVLVGHAGSAQVELIDWETSGPGARWLDLGAGLAVFIEQALLAGRGVPNRDVMGAYLDAYARQSGRSVDLALTVQCAGVRLVQTAVEYAAASYEVPEVADRQLAVGGLLLRSPAEGAIRLGLLR